MTWLSRWRRGWPDRNPWCTLAHSSPDPVVQSLHDTKFTWKHRICKTLFTSCLEQRRRNTLVVGCLIPYQQRWQFFLFRTDKRNNYECKALDQRKPWPDYQCSQLIKMLLPCWHCSHYNQEWTPVKFIYCGFSVSTLCWENIYIFIFMMCKFLHINQLQMCIHCILLQSVTEIMQNNHSFMLI